MSGDSFAPIKAKMEAEGLSRAAILAFQNAYEKLKEGSTGTIPESSISPASDVPYLDDVKKSVTVDHDLLEKTVVLKLNGGLGTSMGLDKAKSLLPVKGQDAFLDIIAKQVMKMRANLKKNVRFMLMNSFSTSSDTLSYLKKYPVLLADPNIEMVQNKVPKIEVGSLQPIKWPVNPQLEWCPPGHGDLYAALSGSGKLDALLADGVKYMFVSNSDNLGATMDLELLTYFAESGAPFMMEVCERTVSDKKGGHLAVRKADAQLILRESAQCSDEDESFFQDTNRHRFFNTNNLWLRLDVLKEQLEASGGFIKLPMIKNAKTVNPQDSGSPKVIQLETAMGAAIECFKGSKAICVPRNRFAPVKKCNDLFLLRSDAYVINDDYIPVLAPGLSKTPVVSLDSKLYKLVQSLEYMTRGGIPSLYNCEKLSVKGAVNFNSRTRVVGSVGITNESGAVKSLKPGVYASDVDLSNEVGLGILERSTESTTPIEGQKMGTSGLRKKTRVFMEKPYLHNFVQSVFDALAATGTDVSTGALVIGGDGRYFNKEAIQIIIKIAVANGVKHLWVGQNGLLSTPATSAVIRERGYAYLKAFGAFVLSASHNPGGPDEDFGIKYNCENGGPAPEKLTNEIYAITQKISKYYICNAFPEIDTSKVGKSAYEAKDGSGRVFVEIVDSTEDHVKLLKSIFDFEKIKALIARPDFTLVYDSMHGVQGPYAKKVFVDELGAPIESLLNCEPKEDFNGGHADPNLTYARELCDIMGIDREGNAVSSSRPQIPSFGAAADGDADRNMILGTQFFVTPSDSVAILANNADCIPYFKALGGLKGIARSMPTSGALDRVAKANNLSFFETPTGWKFFGNLMDSKILGKESYAPFICGEESFGTGSDHVREKDGMWAVLAWLNILAECNQDPSKPLVTVKEIVTDHWTKFGRNYYTRYDYEGVEKAGAEAMMDYMRSRTTENTGKVVGSFTISKADEFEYHDPVDGSVTKKQGIRFLFSDGSRVIFRLSGTAGSGATIRMYIEKYEPGNFSQVSADALKELVAIGLQLSDLEKFTGRNSPTVIT